MTVNKNFRSSQLSLDCKSRLIVTGDTSNDYKLHHAEDETQRETPTIKLYRNRPTTMFDDTIDTSVPSRYLNKNKYVRHRSFCLNSKATKALGWKTECVKMSCSVFMLIEYKYT